MGLLKNKIEPIMALFFYLYGKAIVVDQLPKTDC